MEQSFTSASKMAGGLRSLTISRICGQATKGGRWMPWRQEAMKDVVGCDMLRGAVKQA